MKKMTLSAAFLTLLTSFSVFADQAATLTCTGKNIVLEVKNPYWGENSPYSQKLYILKSKDYADGSAYTAFFLNVQESNDSEGHVLIHGSNDLDGAFSLTTTAPKDVGDGTTIHETSKGVLVYSHGPLNGVEDVFCEKK